MKTAMQSKILKAFYYKQPRPTRVDCEALVNLTSLPYHEISRWFRNERHKDKKSREGKDAAITASHGTTPTHKQKKVILEEKKHALAPVPNTVQHDDDSEQEEDEQGQEQ